MHGGAWQAESRGGAERKPENHHTAASGTRQLRVGACPWLAPLARATGLIGRPTSTALDIWFGGLLSFHDEFSPSEPTLGQCEMLEKTHGKITCKHAQDASEPTTRRPGNQKTEKPDVQEVQEPETRKPGSQQSVSPSAASALDKLSLLLLWMLLLCNGAEAASCVRCQPTRLRSHGLTRARGQLKGIARRHCPKAFACEGKGQR